jgi:hypothetical protein
MTKKRLSNEQWLCLIQDCRSSGLTDRAWCTLHDVHPTSFYRAIKRLRESACSIPNNSHAGASLPQEVVEIASIDENGIITQPVHQKKLPHLTDNHHVTQLNNNLSDSSFETTVRLTIPSGISIEFSNETSAATIKNVLSVLQTV